MCICITEGQTFVSFVSCFTAVILWNLLSKPHCYL